MTIHTISQKNSKKLNQNLNQKDRNTLPFTHLTIKNLKPKTTRVIYWCQGMKDFGIRISPKGTKTWVFEYRCDNKTRKISLGRFPRVSLSKATKLYSEAKLKINEGVDPLGERYISKQAELEALTVAALSKKYIDYCIARGEVAWQEKQRAINKDLLPVIGELKAKDISFREIAPIINALHIDRNSPVQAQRLLSHARCMFKYAKNSLGIIEINPCADLEAPKRQSKKKRALNTREIFLFWHNLDYTLMTPSVRLGLKFMLCTMARGIEVRKMKWNHVNFKDKTWFIPSENAKNGNELLLPLNKYALSTLAKIKEFTGHSVYVFGHHVTMNYGQLKKEYDLSVMGNTAFSHALRDNFELLTIDEKFTPHDLRKTGATCLTSIGYSREWVGKILNHKPQNITSSTYDLFDYFEEKRAGMEALQYILDRVLTCQTIEDVPSLRSLRREFFSKKLIYQFLDENYYSQNPACTVQGLQSISSDHSTYRLSFSHGGLKQ